MLLFESLLNSRSNWGLFLVLLALVCPAPSGDIQVRGYYSPERSSPFISKMDYQSSSRNRRKNASTEPSPPSSSSRHSSSSIPESASIRYYTALAGSSTPYRSPYEPTHAQDEDRRTQPSTASASRASAVSATSRSANLHPFYEPPTLPTKDSLSTGSLSSGGSLYTSSPTTQNYQGTPGGTGSSRGKTMSSVSYHFDLALYVSISSTFTSYSRRFDVFATVLVVLCNIPLPQIV